MKKFLQAAFNISFFQILLILLFGTLKYLLIKFEISNKIQMPFIIIFSTSILLLIVAMGVIGIIENRGKSFEVWEQENQDFKKNLFLMAFIKWARIIPAILGYLMFAYLIAPDSFFFFIVLLGGIVIRNCIDYISTKKDSALQATQQ